MNVQKYLYTMYIGSVVVLSLCGIVFAGCDQTSFATDWSTYQDDFYAGVVELLTSKGVSQVLNPLYYSKIGNITNNTKDIFYLVYVPQLQGQAHFISGAVIAPGQTFVLNKETKDFNYYQDPTYDTGGTFYRTNSNGPCGELLLMAYYCDPTNSNGACQCSGGSCSIDTTQVQPLDQLILTSNPNGQQSYGPNLDQQDALAQYRLVDGDLKIKINMPSELGYNPAISIMGTAGWFYEHSIHIWDILRNAQAGGINVYTGQYGYVMPFITAVDFAIEQVEINSVSYVLPRITDLRVGTLAFIDQNTNYYPSDYIIENFSGGWSWNGGSWCSSATKFLSHGCGGVTERTWPISQSYSYASINGFNQNPLQIIAKALQQIPSGWSSAQAQAVEKLFSGIPTSGSATLQRRFLHGN